ncbi:MAG: hypothetical protein Fur007_12210 [Rhodoferax sp.]
MSAVRTLRAHMAHWPRETRDTWFMLAVLAAVIAPLLAQVPLWCSALTLGVMAVRATLAWRAQPLPGTAWRLALLALAVGATLLSFKTLLGRDAGVCLVMLLLALKTLELRARRDALVVFFLGFFLLLTQFFYAQTLLTALGMVLTLWALLTALVNAHLPVGRPPLALSARIALRLVVLGTPLMIALFVLFPRVAPLWGLPADAQRGRSGLSSTLEVGQVAELALDESVALRASFDGLLPSEPLYWRGPVLSLQDGARWLPGAPEPRAPWSQDALARVDEAMDPSAARRTIPEPAARVAYQVTLEPSGQAWLLALDGTVDAPNLDGANARLAHGQSWRTERPIAQVLRYRAEVRPGVRMGPWQPEPSLRQATRLDATSNPRTRQWAQRLRAEHAQASAPDWVALALQTLRTGGYRYTLEPGLYPGPDTADLFWFDRKQGFCEHIATSFVVLMRALDVPARVVTGYQGGERNPIDGLWTVRQSDAHAWAEVWIAGQGWLRVDPTGAVAPARINLAQRLLAPRTGLAGVWTASMPPALLAQLRAAWDAVNHRWNQWVLSYGQGQQLALLQRLGVSQPDGASLARALAGVLGLLAALGALAVWRQRPRRDPWAVLLQQAHQRWQRGGWFTGTVAATREPTARELAQRLPCDASADALRQWLIQYERCRYAPPSAAPALATLHGLRQLRRTLRRLPRRPPPPGASGAPSDRVCQSPNPPA